MDTILRLGSQGLLSPNEPVIVLLLVKLKLLSFECKFLTLVLNKLLEHLRIRPWLIGPTLIT